MMAQPPSQYMCQNHSSDITWQCAPIETHNRFRYAKRCDSMQPINLFIEFVRHTHFAWMQMQTDADTSNGYRSIFTHFIIYAWSRWIMIALSGYLCVAHLVNCFLHNARHMQYARKFTMEIKFRICLQCLERMHMPVNGSVMFNKVAPEKMMQTFPPCTDRPQLFDG